MPLDKNQLAKQIDEFFIQISDKPEQYNIEELITIIEAIIPVHSSMEIDSYDDVDVILAIYPFLYQKLVKMYAYFIHKVRTGSDGSKGYVNVMRSYRDALETLMKAVRMQYDSLSRRITINIDRRGGM